MLMGNRHIMGAGGTSGNGCEQPGRTLVCRGMGGSIHKYTLGKGGREDKSSLGPSLVLSLTLMGHSLAALA